MSICTYIFFFNDTATTEIYTLSLHDALPISSRATCAWAAATTRSTDIRERSRGSSRVKQETTGSSAAPVRKRSAAGQDRKSTRLNSSHSSISYAVFCLKKKKKHKKNSHDSSS